MTQCICFMKGFSSHGRQTHGYMSPTIQCKIPQIEMQHSVIGHTFQETTHCANIGNRKTSGTCLDVNKGNQYEIWVGSLAGYRGSNNFSVLQKHNAISIHQR